MTIRLLTAICLSLLLLANDNFATPTEIVYLSGIDKDQPVDWQFYCTGGRHSGQWTTIPVPSCWELMGFGTYNYGHDRQPADEQGLYRFEFTVPTDWSNKIVEIVFEGSMTDTEVKINGQSAGPKHQGGFYRFKYDITRLLKFGEHNQLEVTVSKRSSDESVNRAERQADYWIFGGIFRPVYLQAFPREHIERTAIDARADGSFRIEVYLHHIQDANSVAIQLKTITGEKTGAAFSEKINPKQSLVKLTTQVTQPRLWSAETPHLYLAEIELRQNQQVIHRMTEKFGFRTIEVRRGEGIFLNNRPIKIIGVNRHSFWPESGRTLSKQISIDDVNLIKDMNMNAVRMSHYPPDTHFLDVCDALGLYVLDELAGWQDAYSTVVGEKLVQELVTRDVNHPCILFWDNGNEGGFNYDLVDDYHRYDPQKRLVLHPWESSGGINTSHYQDFEKYQQLADGSELVMPTEFLHGLYDGGHGAGLADFWKLAWQKPLLVGGFLWALVDEAVVRTDQDGKLDADGNHAPDGIVGPFRQKEGSFYAIQEILAPVQLTLTELPENFDGTISVENRYAFTNLNQCQFSCWWRRFEKPFETATDSTSTAPVLLSVPNIPPGASGELKIPLPVNFRQIDALFLKAIDPTGREIFTWSFPLKKPLELAQSIFTEQPGSIKTTTKGGRLKVTTTDLAVEFNNRGVLQAVTFKGQPISFRNGPQLAVGSRRNATFKHFPQDNKYIVEVNFHSGNFEWLRWSIFASNWLKLEYRFHLYGYFDFMGISFNYPEEKIQGMQWLGRGPFRVWKNRLAGGTFNVWENNYNNGITGENWIYPEFKGYYANLYWAIIHTKEGPLTVLTETDDLFLRMLTPESGSNARGAQAKFPGGDISFLHGISAIGTKFRGPENMGPQSLPHHASGTYTGVLYFHFGK